MHNVILCEGLIHFCFKAPLIFLAFLRDILYILKTIWRTLIRGHDFSRPIILNSDARGTPVVLVHGCSGNQSEWSGCLEEVQRVFPQNPVFAFSLDLPYEDGKRQFGGESHSIFSMKRLAYHNDWSIQEYANELLKRIEPFPECILIGHSMGGLVCAITEMCCSSKKVSRVIAISSPFQGAPALKFMPSCLLTKRHAQMVPGSRFLPDLCGKIAKSSRDKYLTFGSPHDIQVPSRSAMLPGVRHVEIRGGYGHLSIASSPDVWANL